MRATSCWSPTRTKLRRTAPVRIAHISQIQTFVTDAALPAGLASICHSRGIEVIEAMPKPGDLDETEPMIPSTACGRAQAITSLRAARRGARS